MALGTIEEAVVQLRNGGMVVVVDDEDRENEGDLIMAAEDVTSESMAFYLEYTSGIFCVPLESQRGRRARAATHGRCQHRSPAHRLHRLGRLPPRHDDRDLRPRPRRDGAGAHRSRDATERPQPSRPHLSRCDTARVGSSSARATPRRRSTCAGSPASSPPGCCARS